MDEVDDGKVVLMHGFTTDQTLTIMRAAKKAAAETGLDPAEIAFATTTAANLGWKISEVVAEVSAEHAYMTKKHPAESKKS